MKKNIITVYEKHNKNPFVEKAIQEVQGHIVKKYKHATGTDRKAILQAVSDNGEVLGHTSFVRQIEVDEEKFTKLYLSQFSAFFDLGKQGLKVFGYIMNELKPNKDEFHFRLDKCQQYTNYKTKMSIYQGLAQLLECEIIARADYDGYYFINPLVIFNGNRITYTRTYVKKRKPKDPDQLSMFEDKNLSE